MVTALDWRPPCVWDATQCPCCRQTRVRSPYGPRTTGRCRPCRVRWRMGERRYPWHVMRRYGQRLVQQRPDIYTHDLILVATRVRRPRQ